MAKNKDLTYGVKKLEYADGTRVFQYTGETVHIYGPHLAPEQAYLADDYFWACLTPDYGVTLLRPGQTMTAGNGIELAIDGRSYQAFKVALAWVQGGTKQAQRSPSALRAMMATCDSCGSPCWASDHAGTLCDDCQKESK